MSDQFCLKWNNHHTTLVTVFDKLFECESLVDCTLAAEGKYMKAHKVVLSACSSYLEEILKNTDDKHPILIFNDISYDELKAMLEYMYRGEVNVSQDQLSTFIKAAEALKIKGLTTDQGGGQASSNELRRKVGLKDSRSHSPVVGMTPVERPTSPKRKRRRSRDDNFTADSNSCDTASTPPPTQNSSNMTPKNEEKTSKMKKESSSEPSTTPTKLLQPKIEFMDDSRNMEEYSLEEDEDYGPNPGTSQGSFFGGQDFNNWTGSESQHDDVSIGSQNELNNTAGNSQASGPPYRCAICSRHFTYMYALLNHISTCKPHPEPAPVVKKYSCENCPFRTNHKWYLKHHSCKNKRNALTCKKCWTRFSNHTLLIAHSKVCKNKATSKSPQKPVVPKPVTIQKASGEQIKAILVSQIQQGGGPQGTVKLLTIPTLQPVQFNKEGKKFVDIRPKAMPPQTSVQNNLSEIPNVRILSKVPSLPEKKTETDDAEKEDEDETVEDEEDRDDVKDDEEVVDCEEVVIKEEPLD